MRSAAGLLLSPHAKLKKHEYWPVESLILRLLGYIFGRLWPSEQLTVCQHLFKLLVYPIGNMHPADVSGEHWLGLTLEEYRKASCLSLLDSFKILLITRRAFYNIKNFILTPSCTTTSTTSCHWCAVLRVLFEKKGPVVYHRKMYLLYIRKMCLKSHVCHDNVA